MRPDYNQLFMQVAELISQMSTCLKRKVGAVLVKERAIISEGFNGAPSGFPHCTDQGICYREKASSGKNLIECIGSHAELNAIILVAARGGPSTDGSVLYTTVKPCSFCAKAIVMAGISAVYYKEDYPDKMTNLILGKAGIIVRKID